MTPVTFTHKGEKVTLDVKTGGRPRAGETAEEAKQRKIAAAKTAYKKTH